MKDLLSDTKEPLDLDVCGWDKYGGRIIGDILLPTRSEALSDVLIRQGHAVPYTGEGKKMDWCSKKKKSSFDFSNAECLFTHRMNGTQSMH